MGEEQGRETTTTTTPPAVRIRLFGVDVRWGDRGEPEELPMDLKKSSSMPDLTINPPPSPGEAGDASKGYASDDVELASGQQKRRRRKAHERKKGELSFFFFFFSPSLRRSPGFDRSIAFFAPLLVENHNNPSMDGFRFLTEKCYPYLDSEINQ